MLPQWLSGKKSDCQAGDESLIPGPRRSPGEGNGNPLQYSCLENSMDRGAWSIVHEITTGWGQRSRQAWCKALWIWSLFCVWSETTLISGFWSSPWLLCVIGCLPILIKVMGGLLFSTSFWCCTVPADPGDMVSGSLVRLCKCYQLPFNLTCKYVVFSLLGRRS